MKKGRTTGPASKFPAPRTGAAHAHTIDANTFPASHQFWLRGRLSAGSLSRQRLTLWTPLSLRCSARETETIQLFEVSLGPKFLRRTNVPGLIYLPAAITRPWR